MLNFEFHIFFLCHEIFFFFCFFFRASLLAYGGSQARGLIRAPAVSLYHSNSNIRSEPRLRPTPQLMAMPDPQPTKRVQRLTEPATSWFLVGFISAEPRQELLEHALFFLELFKNINLLVFHKNRWQARLAHRW